MLHRAFGEHGVPRAVEDLPPESWDKVPALVGAPEKHPLWQRVLDELADVGLDSYGDLETVPLLLLASPRRDGHSAAGNGAGPKAQPSPHASRKKRKRRR